MQSHESINSDLHSAIHINNLKAAAQLFISENESDNSEALRIAVIEEDIERINFLLASNIKVNITKALKHAARLQSFAMLLLLLASEFKGDITEALRDVIHYNSDGNYLKVQLMLKHLLASWRPGNITKALGYAVFPEVGTLEIAVQLLTSEREGDITEGLSTAIAYRDLEMLNLLFSSGREGDIADALDNVRGDEQWAALLLSSGYKGNTTKGLATAIRYAHQETIPLFLSCGREYSIKEILKNNPDIQPETLEKLKNSTNIQRVVRTGKNIEGHITHHWKIGGLAFLAARAVHAHVFAGSEPLGSESPGSEPVGLRLLLK